MPAFTYIRTCVFEDGLSEPWSVVPELEDVPAEAGAFEADALAAAEAAPDADALRAAQAELESAVVKLESVPALEDAPDEAGAFEAGAFAAPQPAASPSSARKRSGSSSVASSPKRRQSPRDSEAAHDHVRACVS